MKTAKLYFATNRNYEGDNQWTPKGYGEKFSRHGHENLRFGELTIQYDQHEVDQHLTKSFGQGKIGDGESLSNYLSKQAKQANISAYEDLTANATETIASHKNSSTRFFRNIKSAMMNATDVVINIHGYNVSWEEAVGGALALEFMLNNHKATADKNIKVILFTWPSNGSMMPFAAYKSDRVDSRDSGKAIGRALLKLRDFLSTLRINAQNEDEKLCGQELHLLCHSMGNYLLQHALKSKFNGYHSGTYPRLFRHIFLCSPDVDDNVLEPDQDMGQLHQMASFITIYYNQGDTALYLSEYTKNLSERLGQVGNARPAQVHNKIHQVDCAPVVHGFVEHSYYLWASVNKDIWQSIMGLNFDDKSRDRLKTAQNREWVMK